jgi:hypothetical protein
VLPLLSLVLIVTLAVALTFGQTRYRASAEVSFVLLGSVALAATPRAIRRRWGHGSPPAGELPERLPERADA